MPTTKRGETMTDTEQLEAEIKNSGLRKKWIAAQMKLSYYGLQKKIENKNQFKAGEIKELCKILNITSLKKRDEIFFAENVDKMPT